MKSDYLIELICRPEKINSTDLVNLDKLISSYPYFPVARILYLKAMNQYSASRYRNELKNHTIHIADHKQFYRYLHDTLLFDHLTPPMAEENADLSEIVSDRIKEINGYLPVTTFGIPANKQNASHKKPVQEDDLLQIDLRLTEEKQPDGRIIPLPEKTLSRKEQESTEEAISNPLDLNNIEGVINDYEDQGNRNPSSDSSFTLIQQNSYHNYIIETVGDRDSNKYTPDLVDIHDKPVESHLPPIELFEEETAPPEANRKEEEENRMRAGYAYYRLSDEEETQPEQEKKNNSLIDRFIQADPSISRGGEKTGDNRDLSAQSVVEKEDLFSETLAKIYIKQKLYEKAIATYIKLSLKYPEKSVYFANRIEKIKDKESLNS